MKKIILLFTIVLAGCNTSKHIQQVPIETKIEIRERLVSIKLPADSSSLKALFECDSLNRVILKELNESKSSGFESHFKFQDSKLFYEVKNVRDTVYVQVSDTSINREIPIRTVEYVELNKLTKWQVIQIWIGRIMGLLAVIIIVVKIKIPRLK